MEWESLRDIEVCLRAIRPERYHLGFRGPLARSALADANETRDWRIFAEFAQVLTAEAKTLYAGEDFCVENDSTTIDLCLSLFPWARFRKAKAAVKLHTLLDLRGSIPEFIHSTDGKVYTRGGAFFVTRSKSNFKCRRRYSHPIDKITGLRSDQTVVLSVPASADVYPTPFRRVRFVDPGTKNALPL